MTHVLSLSYGKDSLACLEACKLLGYPIDRVIHAEVWATDTIQLKLQAISQKETSLNGVRFGGRLRLLRLKT